MNLDQLQITFFLQFFSFRCWIFIPWILDERLSIGFIQSTGRRVDYEIQWTLFGRLVCIVLNDKSDSDGRIGDPRRKLIILTHLSRHRDRGERTWRVLHPEPLPAATSGRAIFFGLQFVIWFASRTQFWPVRLLASSPGAKPGFWEHHGSGNAVICSLSLSLSWNFFLDKSERFRMEDSSLPQVF